MFQLTFTLLIVILNYCSSNETIKTNEKPNIILIVTDDQDLILNGMFPMTLTESMIGLKGMTFSNAFTSSPLCCPARSSILSGLYAHNHLTTNNSITGNCYGKHWTEKVEPKAIPTFFEKAGYETFFAGKYLNQYYGNKVPRGWKNFYGLHGNSKYYNYTLNENGKNIKYENEYLTDILSEKFEKFLNEKTEPFFAYIAPPAPHEPSTPADRHKDIFIGAKALRTPTFNKISGPLEKHWIVASNQKIAPNVIKTMDTYFQRRWESLLAVDEMVQNIVKSLEKSNKIDNTFIVYTSDNGYHIGQFSQPFDKRQPYETDIRVPFLVRGPGVQSQSISTHPIALIDLLPTFLEWAGIEKPGNEDGVSFNCVLKNNCQQDKNFHRQILIEYWGEGNSHTYNPECPYSMNDNLAECQKIADCHCQDSRNNTYSCIRHFAYETNKIYCEFTDDENFVEAYDLNTDLYQIDNLGYSMLPSERAIYSIALANLTICMGESCRNTKF